MNNENNSNIEINSDDPFVPIMFDEKTADEQTDGKLNNEGNNNAGEESRQRTWHSRLNNMYLDQLLSYSPYDRFSGNLDEQDVEEFIENIQVLTQKHQDTAKELINKLIAKRGDNCISFFTGFPGVGKTTFINWLIYFIQHPNKASLMKPEILNITDGNNLIANYLNFSFSSSSEIDELRTVFSDEVSKNFAKYVSTINFIYANKNRPEFHRVDIDFLHELAKDKNDSNVRTIKSVIDSKNLNKVSILLFLFLHKWIEAKENNNSISLFFIDNLDSLDSNYLYKNENNFWTDLYKAYNYFYTAIEYYGGNHNNFKFIFSLRNYNYWRVLECSKGPDYEQIKSSISENSHGLISADLSKIISKRKDFAEAKKIPPNLNLTTIIDIIMADEDRYKENVYLPLFNYNIRSLTQDIARIVADESLGFEFNQAKETYKSLFDNKKAIVGARGIIIHTLLKALFKSNDKYPVEELTYIDNPNKNTPFCSECRLLLTLIYNLSYKRKLKNDLSDINQIKPEFFSLDELIKVLRIYKDDRKKQIVSTKNVLNWLEKFNGTNSDSHIHLIDISGVKIITKTDDKFPGEKLVYYDGKSEDEFAERIDATENNLLKDRFSKIKIRINPSAIIYLRYLISHFEFFAIYKYWRKEKFDEIFKPLFLSTELKRENGNHKYEFQSLLEDVFSFVKRKKIKNDFFLSKQIFEGTTIKSIENYLESNFCFLLKFTNKNGDNIKKGYLYSTRIITTHLNYIENFRLYLNTEDMKEKINKNFNEFNSPGLTEINKFILNIENEYVDLYLANNTPENQCLLDSRVLSVMLNYKKDIHDKLELLDKDSTQITTSDNEEIPKSIDELDIHSTN